MRIVLFLLAVLICSAPMVHAGSARKLYVMETLQNDGCRKNMAVLYDCLVKYANRNKGRLPVGDNFDGLRELVKYGAGYKNFNCDAARVKRAKKNKKMDESRNAFAYYGGMNLQTAIKQNSYLPLLSDKPNSQHMNVLLVNGTIVDLRNDRKIGRFKISSYRDIIGALNTLYQYPPQILNTLLGKAAAMDKKYSRK